MAKAENMQTFALNLDKDYLHEIKVVALDSRMNTTEWIREAISEKLKETEEDTRLAGIVGAYKSMGEEGRAWLAQCANIAASNKGMKA